MFARLHSQGTELSSPRKRHRDPAFYPGLRDLEARGYEIVIHGYFHQRPRRSNERITEKFVTRIYTRDEGEFFDLDYESFSPESLKLVMNLKAARLSPLGFVAPAWLLSAEGERAARDAGMQYTTRIDSVLADLLTGEREPTRALVYSVQSGWRRIMSLGWKRGAGAQFGNARAGALEHSSAGFRRAEDPGTDSQFIERFVRTRNATTYGDWIGSQRTNRTAV